MLTSNHVAWAIVKPRRFAVSTSVLAILFVVVELVSQAPPCRRFVLTPDRGICESQSGEQSWCGAICPSSIHDTPMIPFRLILLVYCPATTVTDRPARAHSFCVCSRSSAPRLTQSLRGERSIAASSSAVQNLFSKKNSCASLSLTLVLHCLARRPHGTTGKWLMARSP